MDEPTNTTQPVVDETTLLSPQDEKSELSARYKLGMLLGGSIIIALVLTVVSVVIYEKSGASLLDLSRPGYQSVSSQVDRDDPVDHFSATGSVTKDTLDQFTKLYDTQAEKTKSVDAFNGDPLNPEVLEFGDPSSTN